FSYQQIHCLAWSPDGRRIVAGREDGCLISWHASTGSGYRLQKRHAKAITALAFSPREEHLLLTASADTTVQIWDEVAEQEQVRFEHTASVTTAVWSPDGKVVASCEREDPTISLWSSQTGDLVARIPLSIYTIHDLTVYALAWSPNGTLLAAGCDDSTVQLIDVALQQHIQTYRTDSWYRRTVKALAWSPDGTLLASGGTSAQVDIWQVRSPQAETEEVAQKAQAEEAFR
ncbi:MAG TPA: hypothetical protein VFV38_39670, partial [Ktedonobacteraceae bacterium]|nr:hypothetical protein [Ktedonobacteraceae bacterium]